MLGGRRVRERAPAAEKRTLNGTQVPPREEGRSAWPSPDLLEHLRQKMEVPKCGVYACIVGEFCYPKDVNRKGRDKFGFAGVAFAAIEAVEKAESLVHFTGEGGVVGNPSWWAVKPARGG